MDTSADGTTDPPPLLTICLSCRQLHPDGARCACIVERARQVAELAHELHRASVPRWRRPRRWDGLPEVGQHQLTQAGMDLVEALEGRRWRLVWTDGPLQHELEPVRQSELRGELEAVAGTVQQHAVGIRWPDAPDWPVGGVPEEDYEERDLGGPEFVDVGPVVRRYMLDRPEPAPAPEPDVQLTDAPMLQGTTLRDWLIHQHPLRDGVWAAVVREFYTRAAARPAIAEYFAGVDMERLQQHFTRALMLLAGTGLTSRTLAVLRERHGAVRDARGNGITGPVYDSVVTILVTILGEQGVPQEGIAALAAAVGPLRDVIVSDPESTMPGGISAHGAPGEVQ